MEGPLAEHLGVEGAALGERHAGRRQIDTGRSQLKGTVGLKMIMLVSAAL